MTETLFTPRQVFSLRSKTIQTRVNAYYKDTRDTKATIQILVALQVRDELGEEDFSYFMKWLVRKLLLETKTSRTLRRYYFYFKDYFSSAEWKVVSIRLFSIKTYLTDIIEKFYLQFVQEPSASLADS